MSTTRRPRRPEKQNNDSSLMLSNNASKNLVDNKNHGIKTLFCVSLIRNFTKNINIYKQLVCWTVKDRQLLKQGSERSTAS